MMNDKFAIKVPKLAKSLNDNFLRKLIYAHHATNFSKFWDQDLVILAET